MKSDLVGELWCNICNLQNRLLNNFDIITDIIHLSVHLQQSAWRTLAGCFTCIAWYSAFISALQ